MHSFRRILLAVTLTCLFSQPLFAEDFAAVTKQYIAAAQTGFVDIRVDSSREVTEDGDTTYKCRTRLPGSIDAEIWYYQDADLTPSLRCKMLRRSDDADVAQRLYDQLKRDVTAAVPSDFAGEEDKNDRRTVFRTKGPDETSVSVTWSRSRDRHDITVSVSAPANGAAIAIQPASAIEAVRLVVQDVAVKWHPKADERTVDFALPYKNIGAKTIECTITVVSGHKPRDADPNDVSEFEEKFKKEFSLTLQPGETKTVSGTLEWFRNANTMPVLQYPDTKESAKRYLKASFKE